MTVDRLELLVEDRSTEVALQILLPQILKTTGFSIRAFQGKAHLLKRLPERLEGYAAWLPPSYRVLVLVDRDNESCRALKERLEEIAQRKGLRTRSAAHGDTGYAVVNRIAIEELEAWFFGDWDAVRRAYPRVSPRIPSRAGYRDPDAIAGGTWEAFERVLQRAGYFETGIRKIEVARRIAPYMEPSRNRSPSFQLLVSTLREIESC